MARRRLQGSRRASLGVMDAVKSVVGVMDDAAIVDVGRAEIVTGAARRQSADSAIRELQTGLLVTVADVTDAAGGNRCRR